MTIDDPVALQHEAGVLFRAGRAAEAVPAYERLLAVRPDLPNSWFNLAMAQRSIGEPQAALNSYARALSFGIDGPEEVHLQRGVILADDLGRSDDARVELNAALAINPLYLPAWLNLGNWYEDRGDTAAARDAYARAVALAPGDALALARLAGVSDITDGGDPLLDQLRAVVTVAHSPQDRADAGFALGAALDRIGEYDAAFAAYAAANSVMRDAALAEGIRYDAVAQEAFIDAIIAAFPTPVGSTGGEPVGPLFICGMFRSGSTLIEAILARHSAVVAGGEIDALPALIAATLLPYPERAATLGAAERDGLRARYLAATQARHAPGAILTDKRPDNFLHIGLIKTLFPTARIIHTVRDACDTALSVYFLHAGVGLKYATDLADIAHYQAQEARLMAHWRALYGADIVAVDYDRLVATPRETIADLLQACGLPWEDGVLDHRAGTTAVRTASNLQIRRALYRTSSGRWRHYARHLDSVPGLLRSGAS